MNWISNASRAKRRLKQYEHHASYVIDDDLRKSIWDAVEMAEAAFAGNRESEAFRHVCEARHYFALARYKNKVIFYPDEGALLIGIGYLAVYGVALAAVSWFQSSIPATMSVPVIYSICGGGIGGITVVLHKVIGIRETKNTTTRYSWVVVKPLLGAVLGGVTIVGLSVLFKTMTALDGSIAGGPAFIAGFLGGYLEGFSNRLLTTMSETLLASAAKSDALSVRSQRQPAGSLDQRQEAESE